MHVSCKSKVCNLLDTAQGATGFARLLYSKDSNTLFIFYTISPRVPEPRQGTIGGASDDDDIWIDVHCPLYRRRLRSHFRQCQGKCQCECKCHEFCQVKILGFAFQY